MYIAGLNLALHSNQGVEGLATLTTTVLLVDSFRLLSQSYKKGESEGGKVSPPPNPRFTNFLTLTHTVAERSTPILFVAGVAFNGLEQPDWMRRFSLPPLLAEEGGHWPTTIVRVMGCLASIASFRYMHLAMVQLGQQFHFIAVREKAKIVTGGLYAHVRHPIYSAMLLLQLSYAAMFWSYAPLVTLGVTAAALAIKIPIEEHLIENTPSIAAEYASYKQNVKARLIPGVW